jgi:hypothetical protein
MPQAIMKRGATFNATFFKLSKDANVGCLIAVKTASKIRTTIIPLLIKKSFALNFLAVMIEPPD